MPDLNGMPTSAEVYAKLGFAAPTPIPPQLDADIEGVLAAVIAEFEAPPSREAGGGTGRQWLPRLETRAYDGSGLPDLVIDDVLLPAMQPAVGSAPPVSQNPLSVRFAEGYAYSLTLAPSPVLKTPSSPGEGYHVLTFQTSGYGGSDTGLYSGFPRGQQNILVSATFGNLIAPDIWEALRSEAASRLLVQGFVPLTGVGEEVKLEDFELNTSSGISVWGQSSPIAVWHGLYLSCVSRYRRAPTREWARLAARRQMS